jgi:3-hydroxyisobutyrate dehydrogenase-like beta-hydroxyacid dehydrogenase
MSEISVIGLGAMGAAITREFLKAGHAVCVWNRSPEKLEPVIELGARRASNLDEAIQMSPRTLICVSDYMTTISLLGQADVKPCLHGRTVIQMSTGTPKEAVEFDAWIRKHGGSYLDGAIMANPGSIGQKSTQILVSGAEETFEDCHPVLDCLGGDLRYLGSNIRASATLDLALLSHIESTIFGTIHGAAICESEGVSLADFADLLPDGVWGKSKLGVIEKNSFAVDSSGATVNVIADVITRIREQAHHSGISSEIPDALNHLLQQAIDAGDGEKDTATVVKIMRNRKNY